MERLCGTTYSKVKKSLKPAVQAKIDFQLGQINRAINEIQGAKFGLFGQGNKKSKKWSDAFLVMINDILQDAMEENVELPLKYDRIQQVIVSHTSVLELVVTPCLVHWDLHNGNVIIKENEITGIIDCDRALWGDPLMDVYFGDLFNKSNFLKGYGSSMIDTEEGKCRRVIYNIYLYLIMVVESYYRKYTTKHLKWTYSLLQNELEILKKKSF